MYVCNNGLLCVFDIHYIYTFQEEWGKGNGILLFSFSNMTEFGTERNRDIRTVVWLQARV